MWSLSETAIWWLLPLEIYMGIFQVNGHGGTLQTEEKCKKKKVRNYKIVCAVVALQLINS